VRLGRKALAVGLVVAISAAAAGDPLRQLLFFDDFSDALAGWPEYASDTFFRGCVDGEYSVWLGRPAAWSAWAPVALLTGDFEVTVTTRLATDHGGYGILIGLDSDNFFAFKILADGDYNLLEQWDNEWRGTPIPRGTSAFLVPREAWSLLTIRKIGQTVTLAANGADLASVEIHGEGPWRVGVYIDSDEDAGPWEARYDDFAVYMLIDPSEASRSEEVTTVERAPRRPDAP